MHVANYDAGPAERLRPEQRTQVELARRHKTPPPYLGVCNVTADELAHIRGAGSKKRVS